MKGMADAFQACKPENQAAHIMLNHRDEPNIMTDTKAVTFAHEIGHVIGSGHDFHSKECVCKLGTQTTSRCIMSFAEGLIEMRRFSSCSIKNITQHAASIDDYCGRKDPKRFGEPEVSICGNGVLELIENCECKPRKLADGSYDCVFESPSSKCSRDTCIQPGTISLTSARPVTRITSKATRAFMSIQMAPIILLVYQSGN